MIFALIGYRQSIVEPPRMVAGVGELPSFSPTSEQCRKTCRYPASHQPRRFSFVRSLRQIALANGLVRAQSEQGGALLTSQRQRVLGTGTRTNRLSTYDAASPRQDTWKWKGLGIVALGKTNQVMACPMPNI